mmetsp:Transcript_19953/g.36353  ORF Transcript_19953/g.36353 Transcript_19953/m.36353 type:complete len:290 (-) Transcript_19953:220-1089(-)
MVSAAATIIAKSAAATSAIIVSSTSASKSTAVSVLPIKTAAAILLSKPPTTFLLISFVISLIPHLSWHVILVTLHSCSEARILHHRRRTIVTAESSSLVAAAKPIPTTTVIVIATSIEATVPTTAIGTIAVTHVVLALVISCSRRESRVGHLRRRTAFGPFPIPVSTLGLVVSRCSCKPRIGGLQRRASITVTVTTPASSIHDVPVSIIPVFAAPPRIGGWGRTRVIYSPSIHHVPIPAISEIAAARRGTVHLSRRREARADWLRRSVVIIAAPATKISVHVLFLLLVC